MRSATRVAALALVLAALAVVPAGTELRAHSPGSAALTALTVTAGGTTQTLFPAFSRTVHHDVVPVADAVTQITIEARPGGDATVVYAEADGTVIADADTNTPGQQVDLSMDGKRVNGYQILRRLRDHSPVGVFEVLIEDTGSAANSYVDREIQPETRHNDRIKARNAAGLNQRSDFVRADTPAAPALGDSGAPSNLTAEIAAAGGIALRWQAPAADAETVTGYRLLRAVANSAMSILNADTGPDTTTYLDSSATTPGETYRYEVLAVRGEQASRSSNTVTVSVPPVAHLGPADGFPPNPTVPGNVVATFSDDHVSLQWTTPELHADTVTGYQILRSDEGDPFKTLVANTNSVATTYEDREITQGAIYFYAVKAWRGVERSDRSEADFVTAESCDAEAFNTTPVSVPVSATPIVVESTAADYFVLFVRPDLDEALEIAVSITLGADGTTTLTEQLSPLPIAHYRVEKYPVEDPADIDGDCISDIEELADLGALNPLNRAREIEFRDGAVAIPDRDTFERLSYQGDHVWTDLHLEDLEFVKFWLFHMSTDRPAVYFMNTVTHRTHLDFFVAVKFDLSGHRRGEIVYHPDVIAPDGSLGVYRFEFEPNDDYPFSDVQQAYEVLAASMPVLENNFAYYPMPNRALPRYRREQALYDDSRVKVLLESDIFPDVNFISLNQAIGYGILRELEPGDRPNPRDIVIYESLPNDLPRVAGIITTVPQTPLSHVNLRAIQDRIPNAFIRDALNEESIDSLIDTHVRYEVTGSGYTIRAATKAEVDAHHDESRPSETQTPERDLSVTEITALSDVGFDDWTAFGVKAANVAVLGSLGFPDGAVPDGYAVPFYFYDEFMKANDLYTDIADMLADTDFQTDFDAQEEELKKLRDKIKDATTPDWIITALEDMHDEFPAGTSLRYRSSTNNEDLPGFSGAGLYDSKTQDPDETEEDGIDKSIKGVWASLWNFGAFVERDFHRIDHNATAMGVLVHPNYSDELANGVAVSYDPFSHRDGAYYLNTQIGEDLVTNPEADSVPEALLLLPGGSYEVLVRSNQVEANELLMSDTQLQQLRSRLSTIHDQFKTLYDPAEGERFAMEIEYKITSDNVLAIKQARPWVFRPINEPPAFPTTETGIRTIAERTPMGVDIGSPVAATDQEGDTVTYSLGGLHADQFRIHAPSGQLRTWADLDYEDVNAYEVEVTASDVANPAGATVTVQIMLTNEEERGALELLPVQPLVGTPLSATLTDPDGSIRSESWSWHRSTNRSSWSEISGETSNSYTPVTSDADDYLRATASYTDGEAAGKSAHAISTSTVAVAPGRNKPVLREYPTATRSVTRNTPAGRNIGAPLTATDVDNDILIYSLGGPDGADFDIDTSSGQLLTKAVLTGITRPTYKVFVSVSDGKDDQGMPEADPQIDATTEVTINVTTPRRSSGGGGGFSAGPGEIQLVVTAAVVGEEAPAGQRFAFAFQCTPPDGQPPDAWTFSLGAGQASGRFAPGEIPCSLTVTDDGGADAVDGLFTDRVLGEENLRIVVTFTYGIVTTTVDPTTETVIEEGGISLTIPEGSRDAPYAVLLETDPARCEGGLELEGESIACHTVTVFDAEGAEETGVTLLVPATITITLDAAQTEALGGIEGVHAARQRGELRMLQRDDAESPWQELPFTVGETDDGAVVIVVTVQQFSDFALATATPRLQTVALHTGWTVVVWDGADGASIPDALGDIAGQVDVIYQWLAETQTWRSHRPAGPAILSAFDTLERGASYWVQSSDAVEWMVVGGPLKPPAAEPIRLHSGWTEVVWRGPDGAGIAEAFGMDVFAQVEVIYRWLGETQTWGSFRPGAPAFLNAFDTFASGGSYWIAVAEAVEWVVAGDGG